MADPKEKCFNCGHLREHHIYHEGACRPGFECWTDCKEFKTNPQPATGVKLPKLEAYKEREGWRNFIVTGHMAHGVVLTKAQAAEVIRIVEAYPDLQAQPATGVKLTAEEVALLMQSLTTIKTEALALRAQLTEALTQRGRLSDMVDLWAGVANERQALLTEALASNSHAGLRAQLQRAEHERDAALADADRLRKALEEVERINDDQGMCSSTAILNVCRQALATPSPSALEKKP